MEYDPRGASISVQRGSAAVSDGHNKAVVNNPAFARALLERYNLRLGTWYWLKDLLDLDGGDGLGPILEKITSGWIKPQDPRAAETDITVIDLAVGDVASSVERASSSQVVVVISGPQAWIVREASLLRHLTSLQTGPSGGDSLVDVRGVALLRAMIERDDPSLREREYLFLQADQNGAEFRINSIELETLDDVAGDEVLPGDVAAGTTVNQGRAPEDLFEGIASFVKVNAEVFSSYGFGELDQVPFKLAKAAFSGSTTAYFYSGSGVYETHNDGFAHILTHHLNDLAGGHVWFFRGDEASYAGLLLNRYFDEWALVHDGRGIQIPSEEIFETVHDGFLTLALSRSERLRETLNRLAIYETRFGGDFVRLEVWLDAKFITTIFGSDRDRAMTSVLRAVYSMFIQNSVTEFEDAKLIMRAEISKTDAQMIVSRLSSDKAPAASPWRHNHRLPHGLDLYRVV